MLLKQTQKLEDINHGIHVGAGLPKMGKVAFGELASSTIVA
jgi:hypothetical protein